MKNKPSMEQLRERVEGFLYALAKPVNTPNLLEVGLEHINDVYAGDKKLKREWREYVKSEYKRKVGK